MDMQQGAPIRGAVHDRHLVINPRHCPHEHPKEQDAQRQITQGLPQNEYQRAVVDKAKQPRLVEHLYQGDPQDGTRDEKSTYGHTG